MTVLNCNRPNLLDGKGNKYFYYIRFYTIKHFMVVVKLTFHPITVKRCIIEIIMKGVDLLI